MTALAVRCQRNGATGFKSRRRVSRLRWVPILVSAVSGFGVAGPVCAATREPWEPYPDLVSTNDLGGVGLLQTPTARFAPDGQITVGANKVQPYDRYFFTVQAMPWLEATLRLTTVRNRLYSPFPQFSGNQSYKDRGFDLKLRVLDEGSWTPSIALGLRDFVGTGLFSSEYIVANKKSGPLDVSLGVGWGNIASRGLFSNPLRLISSRFDDRGAPGAGGGANSNVFFKGRDVALFGGIKYQTPVKGLVLKAEYDSNDYKNEALGNQFRVRSPINIGIDYAPRSWLHLGAALERGNKIGLNIALTTNFNRPFRIPKFDPPAPKIPETEAPQKAPDVGGDPANIATVQPFEIIRSPGIDARNPVEPFKNTPFDGPALAEALNKQGGGLYAADFRDNEVTVYVAQSRFSNMAMGLGRLSRAAFSVLPARFQAVTFVFVEGGMETISARVYRSALLKALDPAQEATEELYNRTEFSLPPLRLSEANYQGAISKLPPRLFYSIRPSLKTTLGRPEQFLLYQAGIRLNGLIDIRRGMNIQGTFGINIVDNFDKLQIPSDSQLPHVRSDIKDYLREGKTSIAALHANYTFNITPTLYGHVYGGLFEEMFGGVGAEVLYRRSTSNWAIGADLSYVKQRNFNQLFGFRNYEVLTGFVTGAYYFEDANIDVRLRAGRYLAKDYGATVEIARTFDSGVTIGAFATKTNVSAERFGEGRFDKGIYLSVPLEAIYTRHVRGSVGIAYRPLIRDGGQMLRVPQPLLLTTDETIRAKFRRGWEDLGN